MLLYTQELTQSRAEPRRECLQMQETVAIAFSLSVLPTPIPLLLHNLCLPFFIFCFLVGLLLFMGALCIFRIQDSRAVMIATSVK